MLRKILMIIAVLLVATALRSQSYYFRHYQVEQGLSNNAVICSIQDKDGFMWFGTKDGLNRFNGYTFKTFRNQPGDTGSIGSHFIHCLYQDSKGILWAGTESGLYSYNASTESFSLLPATRNESIRDIAGDKESLWYISGFTLVKYTYATRQVYIYDIARYFEATAVCTGKNGALWVSTAGGILQQHHKATNTFSWVDMFSHSGPTPSKWIENILVSEDKILIGTSNQGLKIFDIPTSAYRDVVIGSGGTNAPFVRNFLQAAPNEYWIATESGIFIYNIRSGQVTSLQKKYNDPYSLSDNAVYTFCKDAEGGIWAGTYFGGINYYPRQYTPFNKYFPKAGENSLSGNVVREVKQDGDGNLWIGTEDAGLNRLDATTGTFTNYQPTGKQDGLSYNNIHGLLVAGNELWVGTFTHGLDVLNIRTKKVIRHYSAGEGPTALKSNFIYTFYQLPAGTILTGTTMGAYLYNRATDDFTPYPGFLRNTWYTSFCYDHNGVLWASTYRNGVQYHNTKTGKTGNFRYVATDTNSLSNDRVNSIFEDSRHRIWMATETGLCRYNPATKNFKRYTTAQGLPADFILSLLEDDAKNLWISTTKGLACFNPTTEDFRNYTTANGLLNDQFNFSSAFKDSSGRLYFGSGKGLISFQPQAFVENTFTPPVYITGIQVNNEDLPIDKDGSPLQQSITQTNNLTLKHNQATFSIDFAALSYTAPEMIAYAYTMEGLDAGWTSLKRNRRIYFTDLSPGMYQFKVKAAGSNGVLNQKETVLTIEILPPFWKSKLAYVLYAIIAYILFMLGIRNYQVRVERRNQRKMEKLKIQKEKEIYEAKMDFFTNVAHEIKTPLTLIKGPLERVMRKAASLPEIKDSLRIMERNTDRLVDLTNQLLDFRKTEINGFTLSFVQADISELLEDTSSGFMPLAEAKNISFRLALPGHAVPAYVDLDAFNKILNNLFSNAVKYADTRLFVTLLSPTPDGRHFTIITKNDGYLIPADMKEKIFEPFFRLPQTSRQKGTGIGLALSRSLAQLHNGSLQLLPPENGLNVFVLTLPLHQKTEPPINEKEWTETLPRQATSL